MMNYQEFNDAIAQLNAAMTNLESAYIENGGEVTEETEAMQMDVDVLRELLSKEGVDFLGSWLKAKEDKAKALKAEKDYISRQIEANNRSQDFIKGKLAFVLDTLGMTETEKSTRGYKFTRTDSNKAVLDKELLNVLYKEKVIAAIREARVPGYVSVSLTASSTAMDDYVDAGGVVPEGDEELFRRVITPTVKFTKPRASKAVEE